MTYDKFKDELVNRAREFAEEIHAEQMYGDAPYADVHLQAVVSWVAFALPNNDEAIAAAWLHDSIEDQNVEYDDLNQMFGVEVADIVALCTDPVGKNRKERKARSNQKLALSSNINGLTVKLCDRLANVLMAKAKAPDKLKMYRKEHSAFSAAAYRDYPRMIVIQNMIDWVLSDRV